MEKLCSIKGSKLYFNGEELLKIESIEKIEVKTLPVRQAIKSQLLNSMATFMSGSLINGNEQCIVGLNIIQKDKKEIWIPFHEGSVTRFNLDYHQYVKNARELKDKIFHVPLTNNISGFSLPEEDVEDDKAAVAEMRKYEKEKAKRFIDVK